MQKDLIGIKTEPENIDLYLNEILRRNLPLPGIVEIHLPNGYLENASLSKRIVDECRIRNEKGIVFMLHQPGRFKEKKLDSSSPLRTNLQNTSECHKKLQEIVNENRKIFRGFVVHPCPLSWRIIFARGKTYERSVNSLVKYFSEQDFLGDFNPEIVYLENPAIEIFATYNEITETLRMIKDAAGKSPKLCLDISHLGITHFRLNDKKEFYKEANKLLDWADYVHINEPYSTKPIARLFSAHRVGEGIIRWNNICESEENGINTEKIHNAVIEVYDSLSHRKGKPKDDTKNCVDGYEFILRKKKMI